MFPPSTVLVKSSGLSGLSTVPHGYRGIGARRTTALVVALGPRE